MVKMVISNICFTTIKTKQTNKQKILQNPIPVIIDTIPDMLYFCKQLEHLIKYMKKKV